VFRKTVLRLRGKRSHIARSVTDQNGVLLSNKKDILGTWKEYFKYVLNPVTITPPDTDEVHLGEENNITAADVLAAWAQLGRGHEGYVPPLFETVGI